MHGERAKDILRSQCAFFAFLLLSITLSPGFLFRRNEGGLSNLGIHVRTVVPYTLAFASSSFFIFRAAGESPAASTIDLRFRRLLYVLGVLLVLVLVSTWFYKRNQDAHALHVSVAVITVCFESLTSAWLVVTILKDRLGMIVLGCQLVGLVLAALTFAGWIHVLFVAQLLTSASFGCLLVRAAWQLDSSGTT